MNGTFTTALAKTFSSSYSSSYIPTTITEKFTTPLAKTFSSSYPSSHIPTTITKKFTTTLAKTFRSSYPSSHIPTTITKKFTTPLAKTLRNTATKQFASLPKTFGRNYSTTKRILDTTISNVTEDMFDPFEKDISKNPEQSCKPAALPPKPMFGNEIGGFGSIIGVLMVDAAVFMTIIIIFSMLSTMIRKEQYPNEPTELNWLELFYGDCNAALRSCEIAEDMKKILGHPKSYFYWLRAILFLRMSNCVQYLRSLYCASKCHLLEEDERFLGSKWT